MLNGLYHGGFEMSRGWENFFLHDADTCIEKQSKQKRCYPPTCRRGKCATDYGERATEDAYCRGDRPRSPVFLFRFSL